MRSKTLLLVLTLASLAAAALAQDFEASGDDEDDDEAEDAFDVVVVPTRVIPELRSPVAPQSTKTTSRRQEIALKETDEDVDFGSGFYATPTFDPTPKLSTISSSSAIVTSRISDRPPILQRKLRKIPITAGRAIRWRIPEDTFKDDEDGNARKLALSLRHVNGSSAIPGWIRLEERTQDLWILPVDENDIGRWRFRLVAVDSRGQSASDILEVVVRQFSGSRLLNHEFEIAFAFASWKPALLRRWEWMTLDKIRKFYGDRDASNVLVKRASDGQRPFVFAWTNSSLIRQECPKREIDALFERLVTATGNPSDGLRRALGSNVLIKGVHRRYFGSCADEDVEEETFDGRRVETSSGGNKAPVIRNPIDRIEVTAGELLRFAVPIDTCFDVEDGPTPRLTLHLLTMDRKELSPRSWLNFDVRNQEFYGVPLEEEVGRTEYQLVCSDRSGLSAVDGIEVVVLNRPFSERFGVEFVLVFATKLPGRRVELVERLADFFGNQNREAENVVVKSVEDHTLTWYNRTLAYAECDSPGVEWLRDRLLDESGANASSLLVQHFRSSFQLLRAGVIARGACVNNRDFDSDSDSDVTRSSDSSSGNEEDSGSSFIFHGIIPSSEYLMTFLVPAVIITCMLLLAIVLACVLHRKRKAGKLNLFYSEALPPRVPVILQDELFEERGGGGQLQHPVESDGLLGSRMVMPMQQQQDASSLPRPTPSYSRRH